jgi:hypothetical protein
MSEVIIEPPAQQPPPQTPPQTPPPPAQSGIPTELQAAITAYRTHYAAYAVTGDSAHKTAYENAMTAINKAITDASAVSAANASYIQNFIASYQNTTGDIGELQAQSENIRKQGPALQNTLAQSQQLHSRTVAAADETSLYVKAGIVFGLLVAAGVVGSL